jgi:hypothetical protein
MMTVLEVGATLLLVGIGVAAWWVTWPRPSAPDEVAPSQKAMFTDAVSDDEAGAG